MTKRIAIFASGSGTNTENIVKYFSHHPSVQVSCILTNNDKAYVIERAKLLGIPYLVFNKEQFAATDFVLSYLLDNKIDFIVLAGFLWLVPEKFIKRFNKKIINIHPALLPKYGGKGMYGMNVHNAIYQNKETETGITVHYVNEVYDEGAIIFQVKCRIEPEDTPESIAQKAHRLEYEHYPKIIETIVLG
ncbi:MAG: phosphoribosylglycinamide formyltransferase [Bacteroidia bacterium]|nr:phosphoribosylglycinamide formyltransferase [Bacteroidia bacterium]